MYNSFSTTNYPLYHTDQTRYYTGLADGTTERHRLYWGHYYQYYIYFRNTSSTAYTRYYWSSYQEGTNTLYTGNPVDVGQYFGSRYNYQTSGGPTNLAGKGLYFIGTPFNQNVNTDRIIGVFQRPKPSDVISSGVDGANNTANRMNWDDYYGVRSYRRNRGSYYYSAPAYSPSPISLAGGWKYEYGGIYQRPYQAVYYAGFIYLRIILENTNWSGHYSGSLGSSKYWYTQTGYLMYQSGNSVSGSTGSAYDIEVVIPVDHNGDTAGTKFGASGTVMNYAQMAETIVQSVISTVSYPDWYNSTGIILYMQMLLITIEYLLKMIQ